MNSTFSRLTGVPTTNTAVVSTYQNVQQQLPADQHPRGVLLGEPGGRRPARGAVLQPGDGEPRAADRDVPGRDLQRLAFRRHGSASSITGPLRNSRSAVGPCSEPAGAHRRCRLSSTISSASCAAAATPCNEHGSCQGGDCCRLRGGARQCRRVDRLTSRGTEEVSYMRMRNVPKHRKVPKGLGLREPLRHPDHPRPTTRRQFIAQGFMAGGASVVLPSLAGCSPIRASRMRSWREISRPP